MEGEKEVLGFKGVEPWRIPVLKTREGIAGEKERAFI